MGRVSAVVSVSMCVFEIEGATARDPQMPHAHGNKIMRRKPAISPPPMSHPTGVRYYDSQVYFSFPFLMAKRGPLADAPTNPHYEPCEDLYYSRDIACSSLKVCKTHPPDVHPV